MFDLKDLVKKLIANPFIRYLFVGGVAFLADRAVFFLFNSFILPDMGSFWIIESVKNMVAVLAGFIAGTIVNNVMSMKLVFKGEREAKQNTAMFIWFTVIGAIGLALSIGGNQAMLAMFGEGKWKELLYSASVAIPVTLWNYIGRKLVAKKIDGGKTEEVKP